MRELAEPALEDAAERWRATTTFDANVVVTAGAGTGKTTLLVDRLIHLLLREPRPLEITEIVALTFTNKAANEMRARLGQRLKSYLEVRLDREPASAVEAKTHGEVGALVRLYALSKAELDRRARKALRQLERGHIATIHSFAAALLRLYPAEAGVDPHFKEDDGAWFEKHFDEQWSLWIDRELASSHGRADLWRRALRRTSLGALREVAASLCSETIPLDGLDTGERSATGASAVREWLQELAAEARFLLERYPVEVHQIDRFLRYALRVLEHARARGEIAPGVLEEERRWFFERTPQRTARWTESDFLRLRRLCRICRGLFRVDSSFARVVFELLVPFALECRSSFIRRGFVSFDGLLVRARDLLRDQPRLREELKAQFRALLVDEFQDTDPIQYEILLYLAEKPGASAADWRDVRIEPGKLFVVGDPKQSIYSFRRADIEGYLDVVRGTVLAQGGIECLLRANFRSHGRILDVVNGIFGRLIRPQAGLQPEYVPIRAHQAGEPESAEDTGSFRRVAFSRIASAGELPGGAARRREAESLARWLSEEVLGKKRIRNSSGEWVSVQPGDVAFLFRRLTQVHLYLEPLRRYGIPYVVEGEKHFYATQEIVDAVNLLRAVIDPYDRAALVGVLRSPLGAVTDREIYELHRAGLLDYRLAGRREALAKGAFASVCDLYAALGRLHREAPRLAVGEALRKIFDEIPLRILAARSFNGEQAVANLEKIRELAAAMGRATNTTLPDVVRQLERRVLELEEEAESGLGEESVDAVRILSIHKAKGLEFPVVILPDAAAAPAGRRATQSGAVCDWSSGLVALETADGCNLAAIYLDDKNRACEEAEEKRLFYVAMTRAREHVLISCPPGRVERGSFADMLERSVEASSAAPAMIVGDGAIALQPLTAASEAFSFLARQPKKRAPRAEWSAF
ncbi:MAG TPA: UvrD-helicase domain-containing protein, partial [Candidatus Eisenbacteria bacterium]|nr:UvrD-helicase domain-containing protein [Candidatus Eisenbacteria bacterium]